MMVLYVFHWEKTAIWVLAISLFLLLAYIVGRKIRQKVMSGTPDMKNYCVLYPLENNTVTGKIEIYFTNEECKKVRLTILDETLNEIHEVAEGEYSPGGNIVRFDTGVLLDGIYYYCLKTDNQKTMKKMHVKHA